MHTEEVHPRMRVSSRAVIVCLLLGPSWLPADEAATARAAELWALARAAKGGTALDAVRSLSATGTFRRTPPRHAPEGGPLTGDLQVHWQLPGQYKRIEARTSAEGAGFGFVSAIDGDVAWMAPLGDPPPEASEGGQPRPPRPRPGPSDGKARPDPREMKRREIADERTRSLLVLLLVGPPSDDWILTSAGEAETPEGRADVIDVSGPKGFAARLFVDQATHLPKELVYKDERPRPPFPGPPPPEAQAGEMPPPPPRPVEVVLHLGAYREVDGLLLPSQMSRSIGGDTVDEWEITGWRVNPPLAAESFRPTPGHFF
jgi:hypothetical protein